VSFKENLKKKIMIDRLSKTTVLSIGSQEIRRKIDKDAMRQLLAFSPFVPEKRRDLELYYRELNPDTGQILVLDNELPLYGNTSLDDVTLRRSPELKEMISIRNVIKILNDSDILMFKGRESVTYIRDRALELLDLRYDRKDIEDMADEGIQALAMADSEAVENILELFVEVLCYEPLPAELTANNFAVFGAHHGRSGQDEHFGPVVMYNDKTNVLRFIRHQVPMDDPVARDRIPGVALGQTEPDAEDMRVFHFLTQEVLKHRGPTVH
jgi:hypothetical protein